MSDVDDASSNRRHLASRYAVTHRSMIALDRSTEIGGRTPTGNVPGDALAFDRLLSSSDCSSTGFRSLMVRQCRHRNLSNSFGTLTRLSQHMHLLEVLTSSSARFFFPDITRVGAESDGWSNTGTSSSSNCRSVSTNGRFPLLFLRWKNFGKGLLVERLWEFLLVPEG